MPAESSCCSALFVPHFALKTFHIGHNSHNIRENLKKFHFYITETLLFQNFVFCQKLALNIQCESGKSVHPYERVRAICRSRFQNKTWSAANSKLVQQLKPNNFGLYSILRFSENSCENFENVSKVMLSRDY
jgi:hypothetical protein